MYYTRKKYIPCDYLNHKIDADSYFFHNFFDVYFVKNRVLRLSKVLSRETYSIKQFPFEPNYDYQSFKHTAELHLILKEILFILENLKLIKKSYDIISKTLFIPYPIPKFVKYPPAKFCILSFFKRFSKLKISHDQIWNQLSRELL